MKHLRRRKLYAEAEGPHYIRSDFFTDRGAGRPEGLHYLRRSLSGMEPIRLKPEATYSKPIVETSAFTGAQRAYGNTGVSAPASSTARRDPLCLSVSAGAHSER